MIRNKNNYKEMLKNLNNRFGKVNAVLANEYIKVYPETAEEHRDMQKFCREEKIEFYVIRPLSERPFKIVMKGLHRDMDIEEIESELAIALPEIEILKVELNSRQESEFNPQTGSREIGYEKEFLDFLEEVKVMYDTLKSIPNLIKTISELPMLEKTEDMVNHLIKALGTVANSVSNVQ
ncbi:hypothetical protein AVEN_138697-1 [Araneus ventricosus]|uniref:Uncharacterized protein n=1 Tax=Araneus ventricosus TaxID=182803 RepID=A0A4Y2R386_ARAVE|nr:hypothetical protein AVEN_138697-1 [Araneus ventricosus]